MEAFPSAERDIVGPDSSVEQLPRTISERSKFSARDRARGTHAAPGRTRKRKPEIRPVGNHGRVGAASMRSEFPLLLSQPLEIGRKLPLPLLRLIKLSERKLKDKSEWEGREDWRIPDAAIIYFSTAVGSDEEALFACSALALGEPAPLIFPKKRHVRRDAGTCEEEAQGLLPCLWPSIQ